MSIRRAIGCGLLLLLTGSLEGATIAENAAVSTPERLATTAGLNVLRSGGTAADAAVTIGFTLAVLRPGSAGLLGGGTALYYDAATGEVWALDFRPGIANPRYVERPASEVTSRLAIPGLPAGLGELHRKFGSSPWSSLVDPAVALAGEGAGPATLEEALEAGGLLRAIDPAPDGALSRKEMGDLLSRIADRGADDVYRGEIARQIVALSRTAGGAITARSLTEYAPKWRSPLRLDFRGDSAYTLAAPSGSGNVLVDAMTLLSGFAWKGRDVQDAGTIHLFAEAERHGWSQTGSAISERGAIRQQIAPRGDDLDAMRKRMERAPLGTPIEALTSESTGFVVIDEDGSAIVVSLSLGAPFGSGKRLAGMAYVAEPPAERAVESSIPLLVLTDGRVRLVINATGAGREAAVGGGLYLRSKLLPSDLDELVSMPRFIPGAEPGTIICENDADLEIIGRLNDMGHGVEWNRSLGIVHAIEIRERIVVITDPRGGTAGGY